MMSVGKYKNMHDSLPIGIRAVGLWQSYYVRGKREGSKPQQSHFPLWYGTSEVSRDKIVGLGAWGLGGLLKQSAF